MRLLSSALIVAALFGIVPSCVPNNTKNDSGAGGDKGTGGNKPGSGGTTGTGGSKAPTGSCADVSSFKKTISEQYGRVNIPLDNNSGKDYCMVSNWWYKYNNQTETINGLSFSLTNSGQSPDNMPMGFPTMYIGNYPSAHCSSKGSNLPKKVSDLTSIPTILDSNASTIGYSNYNVTYDVWFTAANSPVSGSDPGPGGAFLMVWLFKTTDRQPRGTVRASGRMVKGNDSGWDVWIDNTKDPPCISYVSNDKLSSLEFDLNDFIQDAVDNNYGIKDSQYLSLVFAGFEVWGGANGAQINNFCVNVE